MNEEIGMLIIHHYNLNSIKDYTEMYQCSGTYCNYNEIDHIKSYNLQNDDFFWNRICTEEGDIKWYCPECSKNVISNNNKWHT